MTIPMVQPDAERSIGFGSSSNFGQEMTGVNLSNSVALHDRIRS